MNLDKRELREINFESLRQTFLFETGAITAVQVVKRSSGRPDLGRLLRHHSSAGVYDIAELHIRDSFDSLLSYYSLIEIGCQIEYFPDKLTARFVAEASAVLNDPAVRLFYESYYPLLLPQALRRRVAAPASAISETEMKPEATGIFQEFLALETACRADEELQVFVRLLDGFTPNGLALEDLIEVVKAPSAYMESATRRPEQRTVVDVALRGFRKLLNVLSTLDDILRRAERMPVFRSSLWHHYSYWFDRADSSVHNGLVAMIDPFLRWSLPADADDQSDWRAEIEEFVRNAKLIVQRLHSPILARELIMAMGIEEPRWRPEHSAKLDEYLTQRGLTPSAGPGPDPGTVFRPQGEDWRPDKHYRITGSHMSVAAELQGTRLEFPANGKPAFNVKLDSVLEETVESQDIERQLVQRLFEPSLVVTSRYLLERAVYEELDAAGGLMRTHEINFDPPRPIALKTRTFRLQ